MTPKMREAILASIEHWKENLAVGMFEAKIHGEHCPLCNATRQRPGAAVMCGKCPVAKRTGQYGCKGSPWEGVFFARYRENEHEFHRYAQLEIDFLQSLLPESEAHDAQ